MATARQRPHPSAGHSTGRPATIAPVAQEARVSIATVSRVLNNVPRRVRENGSTLAGASPVPIEFTGEAVG